MYLRVFLNARFIYIYCLFRVYECKLWFSVCCFVVFVYFFHAFGNCIVYHNFCGCHALSSLLKHIDREISSFYIQFWHNCLSHLRLLDLLLLLYFYISFSKPLSTSDTSNCSLPRNKLDVCAQLSSYSPLTICVSTGAHKRISRNGRRR